jgi:predicted NAD/FAD-binding protein
MKRVAVIGSGISGMAVARALSSTARVTLFEADEWLGGHAHTVQVCIDGVSHGVDTGFLVFNPRTYPNLVQLFAELGVDVAPSEMSFSVQAPQQRWEWSGRSLNSVFAQRGNLASARFWLMLAEIVRFNRLASALAARAGSKVLDEPIGEFLDRHRFAAVFRDGYLLPMIGCIWSCPTDQMLQFPLATLVRFAHNHGLLQIADRPQWLTVRGGSQQYVRRMVADLTDVRTRTPVRQVRRVPPGLGGTGVWIDTDHGSERFDEVVLACHTDQALALLPDASADERAILAAIRYQRNRVVLHQDATALPRHPRAWAAWNYERAADTSRERDGVCLHYLINRLQPLPWQRPVIVSMNPLRLIRDESVLGQWEYDHPVFDRAAIAAQQQLSQIQGRSHVWFCGAWTRYGFHEDGLRSGLDAAQGIREQWQRTNRMGVAA